MARPVDMKPNLKLLNLLLVCLVSTVAAQTWPSRKYCPCICSLVTTPELTFALGPGEYKQVDCRYRNINDAPSNIPRDTQVLLLSHNAILAISDNIDYLYELVYLDVSHNRLSGIYSDDVRGNRKLSFINMGWNQIAYITPFAFRNLQNLKHLMVQNNKLPHIPEAIINVTSLLILDLSNNLISGVYINSLEGLRNLHYLNLQDNSIGTVDIGAFYQVPQLVYLHLNGNMISTLPHLVFNGLSYLEVLSLNNNQLHNLEPGVLNTINSIKTIDLHGNKLYNLDRATFHGLYSLENLLLNDNNLHFLSSTLFQRLYNLNTLNLSDNPSIGNLPNGLFNGLHNLQILTLSHALSVPQRLFAGLRNMQSLRLSHSRLPTVSSDFFRDLYRLQILELANNNIETLQPSSFSYLNTLTTLDLSHNQLKLVNSAPFHGTSFNTLTTLYLQNNAINELEDGAFANMPQLKDVRLDNNKIPIILSGAFSWRAQLQSITLDNNQIQTIEDGAVRAITYVDRLTVVSNFLSCDCHLISFAKWFQQHWKSVERANEVYCYAPEVHNNKRLIDLVKSSRNPFHCVFPRISTEPKVANLTKTVGENVYLHCHIIPSAVATLTWVFPNEQEVDAPAFPPLMNQTMQTLTNHYGTLILYDIQKKDAGSYKCQATNTAGSDTIVYHINVVDVMPVTPTPPVGGGPTTPRISTGTTYNPGETTTTSRPKQTSRHPDWTGQGPGSGINNVTSCNSNPCQNEGVCSETPNEQKEDINSKVGHEHLSTENQEAAYQVRCLCKANYGGKLCQYRKPYTPTEVTVIASSKNYISLTWVGSGIENVQGYRVLYNIVGERTTVKSVPIHPTVQSYTMESLQTDVSYKICVVAFNQGGESTVGNKNCIWAETQKANARTNSIFNMQLLTIGGSCLAVLVGLLLIGYGYQKIKERKGNHTDYDEPIMTRANRTRSSSIAEVLRKSMRTPPVTPNSYFRESDDVMLIELQGYPERQMYMNPMESSRHSMHLGDALVRDFVPGEPDLFPQGNKRKTLKIQDTAM